MLTSDHKIHRVSIVQKQSKLTYLKLCLIPKDLKVLLKWISKLNNMQKNFDIKEELCLFYLLFLSWTSYLPESPKVNRYSHHLVYFLLLISELSLKIHRFSGTTFPLSFYHFKKSKWICEKHIHKSD